MARGSEITAIARGAPPIIHRAISVARARVQQLVADRQVASPEFLIRLFAASELQAPGNIDLLV